MKYETIIDLNCKDNSHTQLIQRVPAGSDVLEFGCSSGFVSKYLKEKGCTVTGVEINPENAKEAEVYCEKVLVTDIDKLDFKKDLGRKFDVITFGDVLEHLKEPEKVLEYVTDLLKDDGYLLASIPNIGFGYYRLEHLKGNFNYERNGILDKTHLVFFDHNKIFAMFESAGYYIKNLFRIKKGIPNIVVRDMLKEIGIGDSEKALVEIKELLDFEVFQYFVTAYPATEKNALRLLREKEIDYITQIKDINEQLKIKEDRLSVLEAMDRQKSDLELKIIEQKTRISNLEKMIEIIPLKDKEISELKAQLQRILDEVKTL